MKLSTIYIDKIGPYIIENRLKNYIVGVGMFKKDMYFLFMF